MTLLLYVGSVINLGNSFSQATRPKNVGQMSDLIQEYRETAENPSVGGWESFYASKIGLEKIDIAADKGDFSEGLSIVDKISRFSLQTKTNSMEGL